MRVIDKYRKGLSAVDPFEATGNRSQPFDAPRDFFEPHAKVMRSGGRRQAVRDIVPAHQGSFDVNTFGPDVEAHLASVQRSRKDAGGDVGRLVQSVSHNS